MYLPGTLKCFHFRNPFELLSRFSSARVLLIKCQILFKHVGKNSVHIDRDCFHASGIEVSGGHMSRGCIESYAVWLIKVEIARLAKLW